MKRWRWIGIIASVIWFFGFGVLFWNEYVEEAVAPYSQDLKIGSAIEEWISPGPPDKLPWAGTFKGLRRPAAWRFRRCARLLTSPYRDCVLGLLASRPTHEQFSVNCPDTRYICGRFAHRCSGSYAGQSRHRVADHTTPTPKSAGPTARSVAFL